MPTSFDLSNGCRIIAEVAQNHDGSLGAAHAYVDAVAKTGADCIKFQTHIASAESTPGEPWRVRFSRQDESRYDYWKRIEFTPSQWMELGAHARERGLLFLSSPFSMEAVELLERVGVAAWKVGAGEITNLPMIDRMAQTGLPVVLSSGLSSWELLDAAVETVMARRAPVVVLQCTTAYPCPPEKLGLNVLRELRARYDCPVGLSDHSGGIYAGLAAATLGASCLEVHVTFSRECFGPDVPASVTTTELADLVRGVNFVTRAMSNPVDKNAMAEDLAELRLVFGKSIVTARDLPAGHSLTTNDLTLKKPGTGLPPARLGDLVSRRLKRAVTANTLLSEEHLEECAAQSSGSSR
ncbi:MAG TPA: N-acetylneuraminate synthase family protein [Bryobacteraceae bacterium]|nr:N-acetylneuraminate synthase family protein [Bryobacteraceae bacterium]